MKCASPTKGNAWPPQGLAAARPRALVHSPARPHTAQGVALSGPNYLVSQSIQKYVLKQMNFLILSYCPRVEHPNRALYYSLTLVLWWDLDCEGLTRTAPGTLSARGFSHDKAPWSVCAGRGAEPSPTYPHARHSSGQGPAESSRRRHPYSLFPEDQLRGLSGHETCSSRVAREARKKINLHIQ